MNDIVAAHADTAIHVILDNLNTHKPRNDRALKRHPERAFPLHADAGLLAQPGRNLVLDPARKVAARRLVHFRRPTPRQHINAFIETYNQHAKPFVWTKARVHQKRIKVRFAEQ